MVPVLVFGQEPEVTESILKSPEFWVAVATGALFVIEWVLKAIPTSKPTGFVLKALVWVLNKLVNSAVKDKKKGGGKH